jgi:hypothetical protein
VAGGEDACIINSGLRSGRGKDRMQRALVLGASSLDGGGLPSRAAGDGTLVAGGKRRRDMGSGAGQLRVGQDTHR